MKFSENKRPYFWALIALSFISAIIYLYRTYGGIPLYVKTESEKGIVSRSVMTISTAIFPHRDDVHLLFVSGRRYVNLRGALPFYLKTPDERGIVFVSERVENQTADGVLYFISLEDQKTYSIPCNDFRFGYGIGLGRDLIESFDGEILTLIREGSLTTQKISLNIKTGKLLGTRGKQ